MLDEAPSWKEVIAVAKRIRVAVQKPAPALHGEPHRAPILLPECCETRWNSELRLVKAIVKKHEMLPLEHQFTVPQMRIARAMIAMFGPVARFTDIVQANSATVLDAMAAFSIIVDVVQCDDLPSFEEAVANPYTGASDNATSLFSNEDMSDASAATTRSAAPVLRPPTFFEKVMRERSSTFLCDATTLLACMAPSLDIGNVFGTGENGIATDVCGMMATICAKPAILAFLADEDLRRRLPEECASMKQRGIYSAVNAPYTAQRYLGVMVTDGAKLRMPALAALVSALAKLLPSEASVERLFSQLKHIVGEHRSSISSTAVFAALQLRGLLNAMPDVCADAVYDDGAHPSTVDGAAQGAVAAEKPPAEPELTGRIAEMFVRAALAVHTKVAEVNASPKCSRTKCSKTLTAQMLQAGNTIQCVSCHKRWCYNSTATKRSKDCAGIDNAPATNGLLDVDVHSALGEWKCLSCIAPLWNPPTAAPARSSLTVSQ
jgi:hypothetical protein